MCSCYANIKLRRKRFKIWLAAFRHRVSQVCHEESTVYADGGMIMHQSIPPAPSPSPPPGYCGAFARLVSPRGGAFANFALPGGRAFANPRAIPELLTRTRFPIRI